MSKYTTAEAVRVLREFLASAPHPEPGKPRIASGYSEIDGCVILVSDATDIVWELPPEMARNMARSLLISANEIDGAGMAMPDEPPYCEEL